VLRAPWLPASHHLFKDLAPWIARAAAEAAAGVPARITAAAAHHLLQYPAERICSRISLRTRSVGIAHLLEHAAKQYRRQHRQHLFQQSLRIAGCLCRLRGNGPAHLLAAKEVGKNGIALLDAVEARRLCGIVEIIRIPAAGEARHKSHEAGRVCHIALQALRECRHQGFCRPLRLGAGNAHLPCNGVHRRAIATLHQNFHQRYHGFFSGSKTTYQMRILCRNSVKF
jgi:hypothetical protein